MLCSAVLCSCSTVIAPPEVEVPTAWAQQPEELGKLRVGKVTAVRIADFDDTRDFMPVAGGTTVVVINFVPVPISRPSLPGASSPFKRSQQFYRYTIQRKGAPDQEYWDDFVAYPVGSCLAAREKPKMVVPALAQECA